MKVTQEKLPASQIGLEIEISPEISKQTYEQTIQKISRTANIPGFRKGKVPRQVLLQRFGSAYIKATALEEMIQSSLTQAIEQEKLAAIGSPQLRSSFDELVQQYAPGESLTFSATVDVQPEVVLHQYTGLTVQAEEVKPDLSQVDQTLESRRSERATLLPVEGRAAQMGDVAIVDFEGRLREPAPGESDLIEGAQAKDFQVEMAEGRFIPGFIDGMVGMTPGETREIAVSFPEDYPQAELAGQPANFTITLQELKEKELPELNDELAQQISEFATLAELRSFLEEKAQQEAERKTKTNKEQALLNELLKHVEVDLPETLINQEVDYLITQVAMQFQNQGIDFRQLLNEETLPMMRERSRPDAIDRIKRTITLGEVAKREKIAVEPAAVKARVTELMEEYTDRNLDQNRLRDAVEEELLRDKIMSWLESNSTIELVPEGTLTPAPEVADAEADTEPPAVTEPAATATVEVSAEPVTAASPEAQPDEKPAETPAKAKKKGSA